MKTNSKVVKGSFYIAKENAIKLLRRVFILMDIKKILIVCLFLISFIATAQKSDIFKIDSFPTEGVTLYNDYWKWHAGDDPAWANTHFDDSQWENINPIKELPEIPQVLDAEICWFRLRIKVDPTLFNKPFTFFYYVLGASEVYVNGQLLKTIGVVSKDPHIEKTYITRSGLAFNAVFPNSSEMVIAIRYSLTHHNFYLPYYSFSRSSPIFISISSIETFNQNKFWLLNGNISFFLIIGFLFGLAFIHLTLYYFLASQKANLLFGLAMLSHSIFNFYSYVIITPQLNVSFYTFITLLHNAALSLYYIFIVLAIHAYLEKSLTKWFWITAGIIFLGYAALFAKTQNVLHTSVFYESTFIIATIYYIIIIRNAVKTGNKTGLMIYYLGIISCVFLIVPPLLQLGLFDIDNELSRILFNTSVNIVWLSAALSISLTLARDFARTDNSLRDKLKEVERLSNEKQEILMNQNEMLEKQVAERTAELKASQAQLIQKEKLASLGELTAGIAHEIQNPLNFVNNFSELSVDLVKDLKVELKRPDKDEAYIEELFDDLSQNQEKINHHGKRASNIVKGMLEHSRTNTGERVLTDINALSDEYLRLAHHGLRAKDNAFNCDIKTEFEENLPKIEVIPQEIGRVLLNLINNAFYAINEQNLKNLKRDYTPSVTISTQKIENQIIIKVIDNGNGIPDNIKSKIFQPFFTTKPTGEGTGLGLSLSYDIITKGHGGSLEMESTEGGGSSFIITLPLKTNAL